MKGKTGAWIRRNPGDWCDYDDNSISSLFFFLFYLLPSFVYLYFPFCTFLSSKYSPFISHSYFLSGSTFFLSTFLYLFHTFCFSIPSYLLLLLFSIILMFVGPCIIVITESCFSLQPGHYSSVTAPNLQPTANQERNDQCGNQHYSRELLMMGVVVSETYWTYKKYNKIISGIYLVLILQLSFPFISFLTPTFSCYLSRALFSSCLIFVLCFYTSFVRSFFI